jgi:hypothetical protein
MALSSASSLSNARFLPAFILRISSQLNSA